MAADRAQWEIRNEKNKASVRWVLTLAVAGFLVYKLVNPAGAASAPWSLNPLYLYLVFAFAVLANTIISLMLARAAKRETIHGFFKYATMTLDFLLVAAVLIPTGGGNSLLYPLNYIVIVSNALRYGMGIAISGVIIMNFFYVLVLAVQYYPQTAIPDFQLHALKIAGFWLVGIYTGYLARRYDFLRGEVERLEKLLAEALRKNA